MSENKSYKIKDWVKDLQKKGRFTFSRNELMKVFPDLKETAIKSALNRLVNKDEIVSVWKGFYVIVPLKYASRKIVPPVLYIDDLMKYLNRGYYVGLLNAASFHGAAHQQPQDIFVLTTPPALRETKKRGVRIIFVSRKEIPGQLLKSFKTETGFVQVSSPELTAADLIFYQKNIGGINRASAILNELAESISLDSMRKEFFSNVPVVTVQRLGYILEVVLGQYKLASGLFEKAGKYGCVFQYISLKTGKKTKGDTINEKWKIHVNEQIEIEE